MLNASGCTTKIFSLNSMISFLEIQDIKVAVVSFSKLAVTILLDREIKQYTFKIPLDIEVTSIFHVAVESAYVQNFLNSSFMKWDEIMMMHKHCVEVVDQYL